ncbi:hypothetical protein, partial [Coprococcus eutactus]|uniref:hypothetical protein n=1 Tax=Coprococcus eutactus TaxID=33043 RepID=UPI00210B5DEC
DAVGNISGTQESDNAPPETGTMHETQNQDNKIENKKSVTKKLSALKIFAIVYAIVVVCTYVAVSVWFM